MERSPLLELEKLGQSVWMDFIRRGTIASGELAKWVSQDGVSGVTSNPSIFEKAIAGSHDYDESIRALALEGKSIEEIYRNLTVEDIRRAADIFRPVYDGTKGGDGYVSVEVSPLLARDTNGTVSEARQLWGIVDRPNIFIKVPGTREGIGAIRTLITEGINVNVTLLFGVPRYCEVAEAYFAGLEERASKGLDVSRVSSVASFFLSRIDVAVDKILESKMAGGGYDAQEAGRAHGQVAIASAKIAYEKYKEIFGSARFKPLAGKGARSQRLLWASTSTKNPAYSDTKYVEALIGPETVNTLPLETLNAYRDHGQPASRLESEVADSHSVIERLPKLGINLDSITQQLEDDGVRKFVEALETLMGAILARAEAARSETVDPIGFASGQLARNVNERLTDLEKNKFVTRLWEKDATLWKNDEADVKLIRNSLGWMHVAEKMEEDLDASLTAFASEVKAAGFERVVHMGMGGSSLAPLVFSKSFPLPTNGIPVTVLDTTDPSTIHRIGEESSLEKTLFIVASKSGTTAEPLAFGEYFFDRVKKIKGGWAGENFVAITDPSSRLADLAFERKFRKTFLNFGDIGGRYSALSYFGLLPAALMGINVAEILERSLRMMHACASCNRPENNPGVRLGAAIGELARKGKDKLTFIAPKEISTLGMWLEQLIAESTGKEETGILPVDGERLLEPKRYGNDRTFVYFKLKNSSDVDLDDKVEALSKSGAPVITIDLADLFDLGQEFYRWEIATATAGMVLGINPFDQPNVQESKDNTNRILAEVKKSGHLVEPTPALVEDHLSVYGKIKGKRIVDAVKHFLSQAEKGSYVALMAYVAEESSFDSGIASIRSAIQEKFRVATTFGYGPRYLHSTGQFHKGGPNSGVFIQITADDEVDEKIPGQPYSFSIFKRAQAQGDLEALQKHGRKVIRVHLGGEIKDSLQVFHDVVGQALN